MLNWSDKLLDGVEAALARSGWLAAVADAVLAQLLPHDTAQASCEPCWCTTCFPPWWGYICRDPQTGACTMYVDAQCPDGIPC